MPKQRNNLIMQNTRGMIGKQVVFKKRKGTRYVAAPPRVNENRKPTKNQLSHQEKFRRATEYANDAILDPEVKRAYEKVANKKQSAQNMAFRDAYYPPEILSVITKGYTGAIGNIIVVNAKDDFKVTAVKVRIYSASRELIEEGQAIANNDGMLWVYTCTAGNADVAGSVVKVSAYDIPGNETVVEVSC